MMHFSRENRMQNQLRREGKIRLDGNFHLSGSGPRGREALKYVARQISDYLTSVGVSNPKVRVDFNNYTIALDKGTHMAYRDAA